MHAMAMRMPTIAPMVTPVSGLPSGELPGVGVEVDDPVAEADVAVPEGAFEVIAGETAPRQSVASDWPTVRNSALPPVRPFASNIEKITFVPAVILAVQSYDVGPVGGRTTKTSPPGMKPYMNDG
jgi:hypothetical protein